MEFKEFPEAFAQSINEQIRDFAQLKRHEISTREEEISSKYNTLGVIDDSIKSYYKMLTGGRFITVALILTLVSLVAGLVWAGTLGFAEHWADKVPTFALIGVLVGTVGRMIVGEVVGTLFFFIIYPLYRLICNKRAERRIMRRKAEIGEIRDKLNLAAEKFKERKLSDLDAYRRGFEEEVARLSEVFAGSGNTLRVGDMIADHILERIKNEPRPSCLEQIVIRIDISVLAGGVEYDGLFYDFAEHRCQPLEGPHQQCALLMALCRYVAKRVAAEYKKDQSGTQYKLKCSYSIYQQASAHVDYTCRNGWYVPARAW